jgi:uncharacterized protein
MHISVIDSLEKVIASDWNGLAGSTNPFLRHEFLVALEHTGCVSPKTGWLPQHLVAYENGPLQGRLLGAVPMYLKYHSYGEYVFDWAWANAYARAGENYYPKLVISVPFTPASGTKLLAAPDAESATIKKKLIQAAWRHRQETCASSLHWLFVTDEEAQILGQDNHLLRTGYQFHWANPGYQNFNDFLSSFTAEKRKKIKRERRHVREAGITMETLTGDSITSVHWNIIHEFYQSTVLAHGAYAYLSREFFHRMGETMSDQVVLILARREQEYVAGAFNLRGTDTLYGRYWGSHGEYHSLHFETCYYAAIEYCIAQRLLRFEAGAQGEHKLARGFTPVVTRSAHRLSHPDFSLAIADYLARERLDVNACVNELNEHIPFKKEATAEN